MSNCDLTAAAGAAGADARIADPLARTVLIFYVAFRSFLDAIVILSNVFDLAVGGIRAMYVTGANFNVSVALVVEPKAFAQRPRFARMAMLAQFGRE